MRIDEVILSELEFGAVERGAKNVKNFGQKVLGKMGSKTMANNAIKGTQQKQAMAGANKVSDGFVKWQASTFPDADPNTLNVEHFKAFMKTSALLKGDTANFNFLQGNPKLQSFVKQSTSENPVVLTDQQKKEVFLGVANSQMAKGQPASQQPQKQSPITGGSKDPATLQKVDKILTNMDAATLASVVQIGTQKLQQKQ